MRWWNLAEDFSAKIRVEPVRHLVSGRPDRLRQAGQVRNQDRRQGDPPHRTPQANSQF